MKKILSLLLLLSLSVGHAVTPTTTNQDVYNEAFPPVPVPVKPKVSARASQPIHSFTDSQGRTTKYSYSFPAGMDTSKPQPFMVYFHGNNSGTQEKLLQDFFWSEEREAHERGLVAIMVTSPETREKTADGTRHWYNETDNLLIQEFLQNHLKTLFIPDYNRAYFSGASQGTCFINGFLPKYGESYKSGFFAGCGCHNYRDPSWDPSQTFIDGLKVYVSSSKEDFLYGTSKAGYEYYM